MVLIRKGTHTLKVSMCSYKDTFKKLGYVIVDENSKEEVANTSSNEQNRQLYNQLIEDEKKENEIKNDNKEDVVTSEQLLSGIGEKIEENFGFEEVNKEETQENVKKEDVVTSENLYQAKLNALKQTDKSKSRK